MIDSTAQVTVIGTARRSEFLDLSLNDLPMIKLQKESFHIIFLTDNGPPG